jgi:aerobic-type carbon monoxide dehydrogenase small subunit (CoxS/CutS family)
VRRARRPQPGSIKLQRDKVPGVYRNRATLCAVLENNSRCERSVSFFSTSNDERNFVMGPAKNSFNMDKTITFTLNGQARTVTTDPGRTLLEVLREDLELTGSKYGCGESQCGACTVLVDGIAVRSCVRSVESVAAKKVTTIEGLSQNGKLHPVQEAFQAENAFQCGYCTPGMIMGVVSLLDKKPIPNDDEILSRMQGHLCRCCGYPNIVKAIRRAAAQARK